MARWSIPLICLLLGGLIGTFVAGPVLKGQNPVPTTTTTTEIPKELASYHPVVKMVLPAVVSIETKNRPKKVKKEQSTNRDFKSDDPNIPEELRKFLEEMEKRQNSEDETPSHAFGSGFIVDPKGVILTNFHVVEGADQVEVTLKDGRKFTSKEIHSDSKTDLAIVRIDAKGPLPFLELGDSDAMEIGDRVLAVGAPFGLTGSVTAGIISAKGRFGLRMNMYEDFLQTDAAINPGNSGGPLVNLEGRVIGIDSAIKSRTGGFQGVGLAIASNLAKNIMQQLLTSGVVHRGYLGVQIQDLSPEVAERLGLKDQTGVVVGQVFENTPAAKGGIQAGDLITSVAGKPVADGRELQRVVASLPLGKPADFTIVRDGKSKVVSVTIEEQPAEIGAIRPSTPRTPKENEESVKLDKLGLEVTDMTAELAEEMGYKEGSRGALITRVEADSPAAEAGLIKGLLITKADKQGVKTAKGLVELVDKASLKEGVLLQVQTPKGNTTYVLVKTDSQQ